MRIMKFGTGVSAFVVLAAFAAGCGSDSASGPGEGDGANPDEFPAIRIQPADRTAALGLTARFEIEVEGSGGFFYWWQKSVDGIAWESIPVGSSRLDYGPVAMTDHGLAFRVIVAHESGLFLVSKPALLSVASVVFVDAAASGSFDGTSWADAFFCLQEALAAVSVGQEIWVAGGTYVPATPSDPAEPRTASFELVERVAVYGGFAGTEYARELRDWKANETILSGDINNNDEPEGKAYHVVIAADRTRLDGFTVTGGNADSVGGGGMRVDGATVTIANCVFRDNTGDSGGALYVSGSDVRIEESVFLRNTASTGGAVAVFDSTCFFTNTSFLANSAATGGGAVFSFLCVTRFVNCILVGNQADEGGAFYYVNGAQENYLNCTFVANTAHQKGGAIAGGSVFGSSFVPSHSTNCIFWDNAAPELPVGSANFLNSNLQPDEAIKTGETKTLRTPPLFFRPPEPGYDGWGSPDDDYGDLRLHWESPCIDVGANVHFESCGWAKDVTTDLAGAPRVVDGRVDMGAYEHRWTTYVGPAVLYFAVQPEDVTVEPGTQVSFFAHAIGPKVVAHRWQRRNAGSVEWLDVPEAEGKPLSFEATLADDGALFRCVATDGQSEVFSAEAELVLLPGLFELVSPGGPTDPGEDAGLRPKFEWGASSGASHYTLRIFHGSSGLALEKTAIGTTEYTLDDAEELAQNTSYSWSVIAHNAGGQMQCAEEFTFRTTSESPDLEFVLLWTDGEERTLYFLGSFNEWDIGNAPAMEFVPPETPLAISGAVDGPIEFKVSNNNDLDLDCWDWVGWTMAGPEGHEPFLPDSEDTTLLRVNAEAGQSIRIVIDVNIQTVTSILDP